ncbi:uncharacterized protein LOC143521512 isoform X2 [Brachyhypopomus gauderio]|uniref:uncharacterized protein LOC143521512 isoform X2 n=1 Tax=Brachyhypopomus gauderio TaxID=698409 RepID=UPI004042EA8C
MCPKMNGILKLAINQLRREITKQEALVKLSCRAVGGAVVPRADDGVTGEEAVSLWSQHFLQHGVSEPLLSSHYIIAHVLGNKTLECVERRRLKETLTDKERESVWRLCSRRLTRILKSGLERVENLVCGSGAITLSLLHAAPQVGSTTLQDPTQGHCVGQKS